MMFLYSILPDFLVALIIHVIFVAGIVGYCLSVFASANPLVAQYGRFIKPVSIVLFVIGLFFEGYNYAAQTWLAEVDKYKAKVEVAEQMAKDANDKLQKEIDAKNRVIQENRRLLKERLQQSAAVIDQNCQVTPEALYILNDATKMNKK